MASKKTLFPLYAAKDEPQVRPILDALSSQGFPVSDRAPHKRGVVLLFLSDKLKNEPEIAETFFRLDAKGFEIVPVNLDGTKPPELIENALYSRNTIFAERYSTGELVSRIASAKPLQAKKSRLPLVLALGAAALLIVAAIILIIKLLPAKETAGEQSTPAPAATPAPTPEPVIPEAAGISPEDLAEVWELIIVGDELHYYTGHEEWMQGTGWARVGAEYIAQRVEDDSGVHWYRNEDGQEVETARWDDLDFLRYMPNLGILTLVRADATLPDLSGLDNLDCIEINDCSITGLEGVKNAGIVHFGYKGNAITDFSPLNTCPSLIDVHLELENPMPADLSSFAPPALEYLHVWGDQSGTAVDFDGIRQCKNLCDVTLNGIGNRDLSFLFESENLKSLDLQLHELRSLDGLQNKNKLQSLLIDYECENLTDCSALSGNHSLRDVELHCGRVTDLTWLSDAKNLMELQLWYLKGIRTLRGLEDHTMLKTLMVEGSEHLTDLSALSSCKALESVRLFACFDLNNLDPIVALPHLKDLQIYGSRLDNVNFLWDIVKKDGFSFGIAEVSDWSGLAAIQNYSYLNITDRSGSALPYIHDATIFSLELWCRSAYTDWSTEPLDFSQFPTVTAELTIHGAVSLSGLPEMPLMNLRIDESELLTSLDGLENLSPFGHGSGNLIIDGCPRLTDWSVLDGMELWSITLENTASLPTFKNFHADRITIDGALDLNDISCLKDIGDNTHWTSVSLSNIDGVTDLSPLYSAVRCSELRVPAHLSEQAALLVESGIFEKYDVIYPDAEWRPADISFSLLSFDELDTLPSAVLSRIKRLYIAGDTIFDPDAYEMDQQWVDGQSVLYLRPYEGGEEDVIVIDRVGTVLTDFSKLSKLTGLEELSLQFQPFASLEGAQYLDRLWKLEVAFSPALTDASAAFTLQQLEELHLQYTGVTSVQGLQNLQSLRWADLCGLALDDISPIGALPIDCNVDYDMSLLTVEEFFALPDDMLARYREITVVGNYVIENPWGAFEFCTDWNGNKVRLYLRNRETGEETPLSTGPITDLTVFSRMPNLERLRLYAQSLERFDGIEALEYLIDLDLEHTDIPDPAPLFALETLESLRISDTETLTSIEGIQGMQHLCSLNIDATGVTDLSPLASFDYSYAEQPDENGYVRHFSLNVGNLNLAEEQYRYLSAVPYYDILNVWNTDFSKWSEAIRYTPLRQLEAGSCGIDNERLETLCGMHPELQYLTLSWNSHRLTDLRPALTLENLEWLQISPDLEEAIDSLVDETRFELRIG